MKKLYDNPEMNICKLSDPVVMSTGSFGTGDDYVSDITP